MNPDSPAPTPTQSATVHESAALAWCRLAVDLTKAAVWPMAALILFFSLRSPITSSVNEIPTLIRSAHKVSVGKFTLETILKEAGIPPDIRKSLARVSRPGLVLLLDTGRIGWGYLRKNWESDEERANAIRELQKEGLITITPVTNEPDYPFKYTFTPQAKNAYEAILKSVTNQLAEGAPQS